MSVLRMLLYVTERCVLTIQSTRVNTYVCRYYLWDSVARLVTRLWDGLSRAQILMGASDFYHLKNIHTSSADQPVYLLVGTGVVSLW